MKKVMFALIIVMAGFTLSANTGWPSVNDIEQNIKLKEQPAQLAIEIQSDKAKQNLEFNFASEMELYDFDTGSIMDLITIIDPNDEFCEVSITVKVRLGVDSNFVEASATVSGIPCGEIVQAIKKLKNQLMAGIR